MSHRIEELKSYGRVEDGGLVSIGSYLPISEFDAALVMSQLPKLATWSARSRAHADVIKHSLPSGRFPTLEKGAQPSWHKIRIRGTQSEEAQLKSRGIITSRWVKKPLTRMPAFEPYVGGATEFLGADEVARNSFCLFDDEFPLVAQPASLVRDIADILRVVLQ